MKLDVGFDDLPAYDVKYHLKRFNIYMRDSKSDQTSTMHQYCFKLLIHQINSLLDEAWFLSMTNLLNTKFEMKLDVGFDDLPAYDVKYHLKRFNIYMRDSKSDQTSTMHQYCFKLLIHQINSLLDEAWFLSMTNLLNQLKSILKDNDYELFDSYSYSTKTASCKVL